MDTCNARFQKFIRAVAVCGLVAICASTVFARLQDPPDIWVSAYYAGWSQGWFNNGVLPAEQIDYNAITHIIHFALVPQSDGTLDADANSIRPANSQALITSAHAAGRKVLICVGGWGTDRSFREATSPLRRSFFISNLIQFMTSRGYDGIDVDWEILEASDAPQYILFIKELRLALDAITPRPLLAAATAWQSPIFTVLANDFDQINLMTYDLSGPWQGWVTWHNAPIRDGGFRFFSNGAFPPSADGMISKFSLAGIPRSKLGIGIDFYGYIWSGGEGTPTGGVTEPRQEWTRYPNIRPNVPYSQIISSTYRPEAFRWDSSAGGAYLSFDRMRNEDDMFVSYDNEQSCIEKIEYVRSNGIGGVIIWELGGGRLSSSFPNRDRLLTSIRRAMERSVDSIEAITVASPPNFSEGVPVHPELQWQHLENASWYRLHVASDSVFSRIIFDQPWIIHNSLRVSGLAPGTTYYWRVLGLTTTTTGSWSSTGTFTTTVDTLLPSWWQHVSNTGSNATLLIPTSSNPRVGSRSLRTGDAIGVFLPGQHSNICAGFGIWQEGQHLAFPVWADNAFTSVKDGFSEGDTIIIRIWSRSVQREHPVRVVRYASGGGTFTADGLLVVEDLLASANIRHAIHVKPGWNTVSSYIRPLDSDLDRMTAEVRNTFSIMKDGSGRVFWPDSGVRTLNTWNHINGYQVFMRAQDSLVIIGDEVPPESTSIPLSVGWNLTAYLRSSPMSPESAFASLGSSVSLVKNNDGMVYWPAFGVNTIGALRPGEGYKIHVTQSSALQYPAASKDADEAALRTTTSLRVGRNSSRWQFYPPVANTGTNAILLVHASELQDADEVAVWDESDNLVGAGVFRAGLAVVTAWGDNPLTTMVKEGAVEGTRLRLTCWSAADGREGWLNIHTATDALTGEAISEGLIYRSESAIVAESNVVPSNYFLEQNYPNPFNSRTLISYGIAERVRVRLEVFNLLGQQVALVQDLEQDAGIYTVPIEQSHLPTGPYFVRMQAGSFNFTRRILLVR